MLRAASLRRVLVPPQGLARLSGRRPASALTTVGTRTEGAPERTTKARFEGDSIPGADLPPIEPTREEVKNVLFEYGVLIGNFAMVAFIAVWYFKKIAWTKDPDDLSRSIRPLVTRASSDPSFDPILPDERAS